MTSTSFNSIQTLINNYIYLSFFSVAGNKILSISAYDAVLWNSQNLHLIYQNQDPILITEAISNMDKLNKSLLNLYILNTCMNLFKSKFCLENVWFVRFSMLNIIFYVTINFEKIQKIVNISFFSLIIFYETKHYSFSWVL